MKHTLILYFVLLLAVPILCQTQNTDSLINVLNTQKLTVDEQLDLYLKICQGYYASYNSEHTIFYAEKGLSLAEKEKDRLRISRFYEYLGYGYKEKASYDTAKIYFERGLDIAIRSKDKEQQAGMYIDLASLYGTQGKHALVLEYSFKALPLSENLSNKQKNISILSNIGTTYSVLNNYDKAIFYYEQALALIEKSDDELSAYNKRNMYYKLGIIYRDQKEFDKALKYAQESLELSKFTGNRVYEAINLQLIAKINFFMGPEYYDLALQYAEESLLVSEESGYRDAIMASWSVISEVYRQKEQYKESEEFALKAWKLDSLSISANTNNIATDVLYNIVFSNIFLGDKEKAAYFLQKYYDAMLQYSDKSLHDSLTEMEVKYETEKKEMRIASLEKERKLYIWLAVAGVLLVFASGIVLRQKIKSEHKKRQLAAADAVQEGEMGERERLAGELHDRLGGTLSAVKSQLNNAENLLSIGKKLDECIEEVRRITHNMMPLSLRFGIKAALEDFTAQFSNVHFHFFGEEAFISKRLEFVVYCCANELVTNSLRHSGAENINIQLIHGENRIALTVQDDGCGFDKKSTQYGIGLKNINDRVASCNGKIEIVSSSGKGTETAIEFKP